MKKSETAFKNDTTLKNGTALKNDPAFKIDSGAALQKSSEVIPKVKSSAAL